MADIGGCQVKPEELKEIVSAYKDTSDVKRVQSTGLHVAGDKYVVIKADDRSLYGKKVPILPVQRFPTTLTIGFNIGQDRHPDRQDHTSDPDISLPGDSPARLCSHDRRAASRLFDRCGVLRWACPSRRDFWHPSW